MSFSRLRPLLPPAAALVISALVCSVLLLFSGHNPLTAGGAMLSQLGDGNTLRDIVNSGTVYYLAGLAVAVGFTMNLFNIGVEGQYRVAGVVAAGVGGAVVLPTGIHALFVLVVAVAAGALYALIPALLKVYRGVSEVISTIMLNAIGIGIVAYLTSTKGFGVLSGNSVGTSPIAESGRVGALPGGVYGLLILAVLAGLAYWLVLERTPFGFNLQAAGESASAAAAGGVNSKRMVLLTLLISGGIAGLIAMPELLGRDLSYTINSPTGYGFIGIAVALLGRNRPLGVAFGAILWAFLDKSSVALDAEGIPREIVLIMQGTIVLAVVIAQHVVHRAAQRRDQRAVASELTAGNALKEGAPA